MDIFKGAEKLMGLQDEDWFRHANSKSVVSRIVGGSAVFFALWSAYWIGWWSIAFIGLATLWIYANPRLFSPPNTATSWFARGVLGERAFINRKRISIPIEHERAAKITTGLALAFLGLCIFGFIVRDFWLAFASWHASTLAKLWFVDRMAWLWDDMKTQHPVYAKWADADWTARLD